MGKFWGGVKLSVSKYEVSMVVFLLCFLNKDTFPIRTKFQEKKNNVRKLPTHQTKFLSLRVSNSDLIHAFILEISVKGLQVLMQGLR